jgi:hypothetical protein
MNVFPIFVEMKLEPCSYREVESFCSFCQCQKKEAQFDKGMEKIWGV